MPKLKVAKFDPRKIADKFQELNDGVGYSTPGNKYQAEFEYCVLYAMLACAMYPSLYEKFKERVECAPDDLNQEDR